MTVTLIYGGKSGEHEISLVSAAAIARGLSKNYSLNLVAITKKGKWYLQPASELERILADSKAHFEIIEDEKMAVSVVPASGKNAFTAGGKVIETDCVFPALHGSFGEDGNIQGLFEMAEVPYVGCTTMSSALTMDKEKTKQVWQAAGLPVVPYVCMPRSVMMDSVVYDAFLDEAEKELGYPMFVKPSSAGSSNGAAKAKSRKELAFALMEAFQWDDKVLIEKSIDNAREIECSVTGNAVSGDPNNDIEDVVAYIPGEILPSHDFYDYDAKYNDENGAALQIPANLSEEGLEKIRKAAVAAYKVLDCSGLSRVDFFISKEDGQVFLNEINTLPGFTPISMFPKMCEAAGLEFADLTKLLIDEALAKFNSKNQLIRSR